MPLKSFRPVTPTLRYKTVSDFADVTQGNEEGGRRAMENLLATNPDHLELVWTRLKAIMHPEAAGRQSKLSPVTREMTLSVGRQLWDRGMAKLTYTNRNLAGDGALERGRIDRPRAQILDDRVDGDQDGISRLVGVVNEVSGHEHRPVIVEHVAEREVDAAGDPAGEAATLHELLP